MQNKDAAAALHSMASNADTMRYKLTTAAAVQYRVLTTCIIECPTFYPGCIKRPQQNASPVTRDLQLNNHCMAVALPMQSQLTRYSAQGNPSLMSLSPLDIVAPNPVCLHVPSLSCRPQLWHVSFGVLDVFRGPVVTYWQHQQTKTASIAGDDIHSQQQPALRRCLPSHWPQADLYHKFQLNIRRP